MDFKYSVWTLLLMCLLNFMLAETPWPESIEEDKVEAALSNGHSVDETLPPLHVAQVKFEPSKSCIVGCVR